MKKKIFSILMAMIVSLTLVFICSNSSWAAEKIYPSHPVEMICGYPPGGAMDLTMRTWSKYLEKYLGVPVVPVNKPGAGAIIACTYVANSKPDGYTLGCVGDHLVINIFSGKATYSLQDFRYVCLTNLMANALGVAIDSQWKTIQEFIDYAKKNPGVKCAHPGIGSSAHLRMENLNKFANLKMVGVPLQGDAEVIPAVLGKHLPIGVFGGAAAKAQADAGKIRILMSFDPPAEFGLDPKIQDLQTVFGKNMPDVDVAQYLVVPRKTPDDIVQVLTQAMEKVTKDREFIKELNSGCMGVKFVDGGTLIQKILPEKNSRLQAIMKEAGLAK